MTRCPYCGTDDHPVGAGYCYVCGCTLREGGKPHSQEPTFTLYGRDPVAPVLVRMWAAQKWSEHADADTVASARNVASAMAAWHSAHLGDAR